MKKIFLLLAISFCFGRQLQSQETQKGVYLGLNANNINSPYSRQTESHYLPNIGFFMTTRKSYHFGYTWDLNLMYKADKSGFTTLLPESKPVYLQFPVSFDYYFSNKVSAYLGPEFGIRIFQFTGTRPWGLVHELSMMTGINYSISDNFNIGIRYSHGLTPAMFVGEVFTASLPEEYKTNYIQAMNDYGRIEIYNYYFQLNLRYKFPEKKKMEREHNRLMRKIFDNKQSEDENLLNLNK